MNPPITDAQPSSPGRVNAAIEKLVHSTHFERFVIGLVLVNAVLMGVATYDKELQSLSVTLSFDLLKALDRAETFLLVLFSVEILLRLYVSRSKFFAAKWNIFDALLVAVSWLDQFSVVAAFRVLRILRLARIFLRYKPLRLIATLMWDSVLASSGIGCFMLLIMFIYAILGMQLYSVTNPELFGSLHKALYTLFRVAAFYSYEEVITTLSAKNSIGHLYLMPYFLVMNFVLFNFFSAIVLYLLYELTLDEIKTGEAQKPAPAEAEPPAAKADDGPSADTEDAPTAMATELASIRAQLDAIRIALDNQARGAHANGKPGPESA